MIEGSVNGLKLGTGKGNKLGLRDSKVLDIPLGAMFGLPLGTYDGSDLVSSEFLLLILQMASLRACCYGFDLDL